MDTAAESDDVVHSFCIGQHETNRLMPVTPFVVQKAHASNYDMLTTPITTPHFHSRVLTLLSSHLSNTGIPRQDAVGTLETSRNTRVSTVPPLSALDTHLTPHESTSQMVGMTSSWIDICSPDPLIADISRQILMLEVAYAAFCGISYLVIPGPRLHHGALHGDGVMYYARAIQEALEIGPYIQIHIWLRMVDHPTLETHEMGDLAPFAREEYLSSREVSPSADQFGTWDAWDVIRTICKYHIRLMIALSLPKQLPSVHVQARWHCEPVHLLTIEASTFIKNQKGYPVLSKAHQGLIARFMRLRTPPWILLCDVGPIPGILDIDTETSVSNVEEPSPLASSNFPSLAQAASQGKKHHDPVPHLSYMRNLQQRQPPRTAIERFGVGYQDYLQAPLQPLTVNLESITYEVFEKDPIKYEWYERAICQALSDWMERKKPTSSPDGRVVVAVVGAGRGPLVTRALRASVATGVKIEMWAVEKNPNAFVLLQRHNENIWGGAVNLIKSDMRSWKGPSRNAASNDNASPVTAESSHTPVDILVSELLGSFGDNELSPECLDGVTHLLNPVHGISIPASYSAHLTPISAPRLHADISAQKASNPTAPEIPYVVMLHAIDYLSPAPTASRTSKSPESPSSPTAPSSAQKNAPKGSNLASQAGTSPSTPSPPVPIFEPPPPLVQTAWSFSHPNSNSPTVNTPAISSSTIPNEHNTRRARLTFPCPNRGVCHGLGGYFETVLYDDIELSTNPVTMEAKSDGMISWFPIYFPLKTPLTIPDNAEIVVNMYRQTDNRKVWYEWMVEVFKVVTDSPAPSGATQTETGTQTASASDNKKGVIPIPVSPDEPHTMSGAISRNGRSLSSSSQSAAPQPQLRRVRVGLSEMHSSIKEGCLM